MRWIRRLSRPGRRPETSSSRLTTLGISDGKTLYAVRYASDGEAPTLYYSKAVEDLIGLGLAGEAAARLGPEARMIVSEPIGKLADAWVTVPQSSALRLRKGSIEVMPFRPKVPEPRPLTRAGSR